MNIKVKSSFISAHPSLRKKSLSASGIIILRSVVGLTAENLTLSDNFGNILNDFESLAESDRLDNIRKGNKIISEEEEDLRKRVLESLQKNFNGADRVRDLVVKIEKDLNFVSKDQTIYTPVIITEQDPDKPYDTTEKRESITLSSQEIKKTWTGTGYNPEGPAGVEGQNPPGVTPHAELVTGTSQREEYPRAGYASH